MSSSPMSRSALDPSKQTFPILTEAQIARVRAVAKPRKVEPGEVLFSPRQTGIPVFVILSGKLEIVQPDPLRKEVEREVTTHEAGGFTGELNTINGQPSLVLGRVSEAGEVLEISPEAFRSLVARDSELSDITLRAFILRRLALLDHNLGSLVLLGSRHSAETLRLREFLTRNNLPNTYVDLDADKDSQKLLDHFQLKIDDVPVAITIERAESSLPSSIFSL